MIISLHIKLIGGRYYTKDWQCELEINEDATLNDLHSAIQDIVNFEDDHLYLFYVARTESSRPSAHYDDDELDCRLKELFPLEKNRTLFYWFDFGDDWKFQINRTRKKPKAAEPGSKYPRLVSEAGHKPIQYPALKTESFS